MMMMIKIRSRLGTVRRGGVRSVSEGTTLLGQRGIGTRLRRCLPLCLPPDVGRVVIAGLKVLGKDRRLGPFFPPVPL